MKHLRWAGWLAPVLAAALVAPDACARSARSFGRAGVGIRSGAARGHFRSGFRHSGFSRPRVSGRIGFASRRFNGRILGFGFGHRIGLGDFRFQSRRFPSPRFHHFRRRPRFSHAFVSPFYLPYGYHSYPSTYYSSFLDPYVYYRPPRVVVIDRYREVVPEREARPGDREQDDYYLAPERQEGERSSEETPARLADFWHRYMRVETVEGGACQVRWIGETEGLSSIKLQSLAGDGQVLDTLQMTKPPLQGRLRVPERTATIVISLQYAGGSSAEIRLPVIQFKARADALKDAN